MSGLIRGLVWFVSALAFGIGSSSAQTVHIWFYRTDDFVSAERPVSPGAERVDAALHALVAGPTTAEVEDGLTSPIAAGTSIIGLKIEGNTLSVDLSTRVLASLDEASMTAMYKLFRATLRPWPGISSIRLTCQGRLLASYLSPVPQVGVAPVKSAKLITSEVGLVGRKIALGPSHGRYHGTTWAWQRTDPCQLGFAVLEDLNSVRLCTYLAQYLTQDGATVFIPRQMDQTDCCDPFTFSPWWQMCAQTWLHQNNYPCSIWAAASLDCGPDTNTNRYNDDIRSRPLFADFMGTDIYIAHHTNAGGNGTGTETYFDSTMDHQAHVAGSHSLANAIDSSVVLGIREVYDPTWVDNGVKDSTGAYGEIRIPNRPACLIELAYHDRCNKDGPFLTDNFFRSVAEWSLYRGICTYFGTTPGWDRYSDEYVSDTIPATMVGGERYDVSIIFRNRGVSWSEERNFRLGAVDDQDPFTATTRVRIPTGDVSPGATYTFNIAMRAPRTPGTYVSDWRMVRDGFSWFGDTLAKSVVVTDPYVPGDVNLDGDVDMEDFAVVQACLTGTGIAQTAPACARAHVDLDDDVDADDVRAFLDCFTGPGAQGSYTCAGF